MKNVWGWEIPRVEDVIVRDDLHDLMRGVTERILGAIGQKTVSHEVFELLVNEKSNRPVVELEKLLHDKIVRQSEAERELHDGMRNRANIIFSQIAKYLVGDSLADVGCGHGLVSWAARDRFKDILLLDILDYRDPDVSLPFRMYSQTDAPPFERSFDCTLLITVLHHAIAPLELLKIVWGCTRQRLIIIESVFGVTGKSTDSPLPQFDTPTQLCYAVFCDWFYNRVLNQDVSVPYTFNTPEKWREIFRKLPATIAAEADLGVDLDIVPEHHFIFVLDRAA